MRRHAFDAFLSYSRKADGECARKLQASLARIARPWYRRRALRIFRDETTLAATPELWPTIQQALDGSKYFVLLASPEAAASAWVNQELSYWLASRRGDETPPGDRILIALTDGRIVWDERAGDFDWDASNALPPALKAVFRAEPMYVDLTWVQDKASLSLKNKPWFDNIARLAAAIRGMALDDLIGEDIRQHRIALGLAATAGVLLVALGSTAIFTWRTASVLTTEKRHQMDAERVLPQLAGQLDSVRNLPTRALEITFDPRTYFVDAQPRILELRLELDPLFTQPMSIYFARFVEGHTWPPEFTLEESPYTEFSHGRARVDAKFRWFDRVAELSQVIDGTETGTTPSFRLDFDGKDFVPGGPGIHLRQTFQIPSLQELIDKQVRFRLIEHDPVRQQASEVDPSSRKLELRVISYHPDHGAVSSIVLFDARQSALEATIAAGDYLVNRGPIERTVLLNMYPPIAAERAAQWNAKREHAARLVETRDVRTDDDRRLLARALRVSASVSVVRGDNLAALNGFVEITRLLEPLVFDPTRTPTREDAEPLFNAAVQPVAYFVRAKKFDKAQQYAPNLALIAERMIASDPTDLDYLRWRARSLLYTTYIAIGTGAQLQAATALEDFVVTQEEIQRRVDNPVTRSDLAAALEEAERLASSLHGRQLPVGVWRSKAAELRKDVRGAGEAERDGESQVQDR